MKTNHNRIGVIWIIISMLALSGCMARRVAGPMGAPFGEDPASVETARLTRGPLSVTVSAIGNVHPAQSAVLSWQTNGKVGEVSVKVGQQVAADEILASLEPTSLSNAILQAQIELINAQNALETLQEPDPLAIAQAQTNLEAAQQALTDLQNPSESAIAQAELAVINAQEAVNDAQYDLDSLLNGRGNAQLINQARANYLVASDRVEQMESIYNSLPGDPREDVRKAQALSNLDGAKKDRDRALASLNWYLGEPTAEEKAEKETNLALAKAKLIDAQNTVENLKSPDAADLTLAQARVDDAQEKLDTLLAGPTEDDLVIAQSRIIQAQATLNLAQLSAPIAGTVTQVEMLKGDLVNAGKQAIRIDNLSSLLLDLQVSEIDIAFIQVGQPVSVTVDAIPDQTFPGVVAEIGQVGSSNNQGAIEFTVTVRMSNPDPAIKSGMTAVASIQVAQVADVLQLPSQFIFDEGGKKVIYRQNGEDVERIIIQVGMTSDTASEVISDKIKEGDVFVDQAQGFFTMRQSGPADSNGPQFDEGGGEAQPVGPGGNP